ncbi:MAG: YdbL family protein [Myxococcota bacterium]
MNQSKRTHRTVRAVASAMVAAALLFAPAAQADGLADAKAAGLVGERADGMLGIVASDAPGDVVKLVETVNARRRALYAKIADKNGTSPAAVAARAGEKAIAKTASGNYIQDPDGRWVKKP